MVNRRRPNPLPPPPHAEGAEEPPVITPAMKRIRAKEQTMDVLRAAVARGELRM